MPENIPNEKQSHYVCDYYRSFIQSALEPILFNSISGIDWQVLVGTFIQDQLEDMHKLDEDEVIQYIFERKPSQRVKDLIRRNEYKNDEERRSGLDRRGEENADRRNSNK